MTNNNFRARSSSGNGTSGNHEEGEAPNPEERRQNLKYAVFYLVVAIILFLNNRVSKHPTDNGNLSQSASNLGIDLSADRKFEGNGTEQRSQRSNVRCSFSAHEPGEPTDFLSCIPGHESPHRPDRRPSCSPI